MHLEFDEYVDSYSDEEEEVNEETFEKFKQKCLLRIFDIGHDYVLTLDDVNRYKGKTLQHKIANYVVSDLSGKLRNLGFDIS